ncbi:MAG: hypothetical protein K8R77_12285 [Anaerolineaceae bacterium]|nr:hypothetical protein [Anaerolineaceae bacterium]
MSRQEVDVKGKKGCGVPVCSDVDCNIPSITLASNSAIGLGAEIVPNQRWVISDGVFLQNVKENPLVEFVFSAAWFYNINRVPLIFIDRSSASAPQGCHSFALVGFIIEISYL